MLTRVAALVAGVDAEVAGAAADLRVASLLASAGDNSRAHIQHRCGSDHSFSIDFLIVCGDDSYNIFQLRTLCRRSLDGLYG